MIVLSVTNCPQQLRGDLTKWFIEIDVGVYVGTLSARVRDRIWMRVCENIKTGKAIMVYSSNNEQGFQILTHNTDWTPIECEGVWLMQKPCIISGKKKDSWNISKVEMQLFQKKPAPERKKNYVILDIETTGLNCNTDDIIEIGMLKIENGEIAGEFQAFINPNKTIPQEIVRLTGITQQMIDNEGKTAEQVLEDAANFTRNNLVVGYNIDFDISFINHLCDAQNSEKFIYRSKDILRMVKRKIDLNDYRLEAVAVKCGIDISKAHRALEDCKILFNLITKLNII